MLNELKILLKSLRDLAEGKQTKFSYFIGLSWIHLEKRIEKEDMLICPLDSADNPGLYTSLISGHENNKLLGAIACIKIPIKVVGSGKERSNLKVHPDKEISKLMKKINVSLFFALNKNNGITITFSESGFALEHPGSYVSNPTTFHSFNVLENDDFISFSYWLKKIDDSIYKHFQIAFDRLHLILSERRHPIDAIVDGVIAWESLFGGPGETQLKVCGSILKLLDPEDKQKFYDELKEVYNARNRIVHGGESNLNKLFEKVKNPVKFVCDVSRKCLVKIINERKDLMSLKPNERRYRKILLDI